jgi:hypothetical protein
LLPSSEALVNGTCQRIVAALAGEYEATLNGEAVAIRRLPNAGGMPVPRGCDDTGNSTGDDTGNGPISTSSGSAKMGSQISPRLRYSGTSIGYQLASIIAGGPAPIIATWLFATYHSSLPIALYILLLAIIGIIATSMLTDYTNKDISAEYAGV